MFSDEVSSEDRRKALALRVEAARPAAPFPSEGHARLEAILDGAPSWLLADVSREMFEDYPSYKQTPEQKVLAAFAVEAGLEPLPYALSRVGLASAIKARMGRCGDAERIAGILERRLAQEVAAQASVKPAERKRRIMILQDFHPRGFDLARAMEQKHRREKEAVPGREPPPPSGPFEKGTSFPVEGGLTARRMYKKEAAFLGDLWEDGWLDASPRNAVIGTVPGKMARRDMVARNSDAGMLLGVFDSSRSLVASITARSVSETAAEIGWFVVPEARGQGIATSAAAAAVEFLAGMGYREFGARTLAANVASVRVMEKLGFRPVEGHVATGSDIDWIPMTASIGSMRSAMGRRPDTAVPI